MSNSCWTGPGTGNCRWAGSSASKTTSTVSPLLGTINWGGVALGAATGIFSSLVVNIAIGLLMTPLAAISILIHLAATVAAGYIAGRFAPEGTAPLNGGLAGLLIFFFVGVVSLLASSGPNPLELVMLGVVAAVLGSAGGVLADRRRID
jgi:hypothetical protein